jgi:uncharacterized tellurite resistance protein B-like protein
VEVPKLSAAVARGLGYACSSIEGNPMNIQDYAIPFEDRLPFLKFMAYIAQVDNEVSIEEKQAIDGVIFAWHLDEKAVMDIYDVLERGSSVKNFISEFKNKRSYYFLLQELITLAHLDGNYDKSEQKAVREIAALCAISKSRVEQIESWVKEGMAWREKGLALATPEEE